MKREAPKQLYFWAIFLAVIGTVFLALAVGFANRLDGLFLLLDLPFYIAVISYALSALLFYGGWKRNKESHHNYSGTQ